ncbi:uncharacterized protein LOC128547459 [Mercenaria mercenaria]|uniref:uncharacterized protein LOC128547459 n=1 Tax=Mercenaria mercenaria TaxID=6596 RepID=UPI00234EFC3E|nr:uncharacterized protein LOC128547459 [Mercenaria mercenaria]
MLNVDHVMNRQCPASTSKICVYACNPFTFLLVNYTLGNNICFLIRLEQCCFITMKQMNAASIKVRNYMTNKKVWAVISKRENDVGLEKILSGDKNHSNETVFVIRNFFGIRVNANTILKPGMMMVYPRSIGQFVKYDRGCFMCPNKYVFATVAFEGEDGLEFKWNKIRIRQNSDIVISANENVNPETHPTRFERYLKYVIFMLPVLIFRVYVTEKLRQAWHFLNEPFGIEISITNKKRSGPKI